MAMKGTKPPEWYLHRIWEALTGGVEGVTALVLGSGENHAGQVGGHETVIGVIPTITAGAYIAKDAVGGRLDFSGAARLNKGSGIIQSVTLVDLDSEAAELVLVLFDRPFTATADNGPFDPSDADLLYCVGKITIAASDYTAFNDNSVAQVRNLGIPFVCGLDDTLYGQLMCTGTPTYTATSDLVVKLHIMQD